MGKTILKRIKSETNLPSSAGLATSKLVAKIASDFEKPEGFTVVQPGTESKFLAPLEIRKIYGILKLKMFMILFGQLIQPSKQKVQHLQLV